MEPYSNLSSTIAVPTKPPVALPAKAHAASQGMGVLRLIRLLLPYFRPYPRLMLATLALTVVGLVADAFARLGFKFIIDEAIIPGDRGMLVRLIFVLGAATVLTSLAAIAAESLYSRLGAHVVNDIRERVFAHLQTLSAQYYRKSRIGDQMARFSTDVSYIETAVYYGVGTGVASVLGLTFAIGPLFFLSWQLALATAVLVPLALLGPVVTGPRASAASYETKEDLGRLQAAVAENLLTQDVVRAFRLQGWSLEIFRRLQADLLRATIRFNVWSYTSDRVPTVILSLVNLLILGGSAVRVFSGHMTIGALVAFQVFFANVVAHAQTLMSVCVYLLQATGGMLRIEEIFTEKPTVQDEGKAVLGSLTREITFDGVTFDYGDRVTRVHNLRLSIPIGSRVAIVGPSGSGKSTLLNLLIRFWDPVSGSVRFDGVPSRDFTLDSVRSRIGMVFQESMLFDTSILENIRLGCLTATDAEVEKASKLAELHDYVATLPEGYATRVGERGAKLSGGQRQRVAIARAILASPALLLLDEATASLDPATAAAVWRTLVRVGENRTMIYVTHHVDQAASADEIIVLDGGRCVERGAHRELMETAGLYKRMHDEQSRADRAPDDRRSS